MFRFYFINDVGKEQGSFIRLNEFDTVFKYLPADKYQKMKAFL